MAIRSLSLTELANLATDLQEWRGFALQDFYVNDKEVGLGLWTGESLKWLVFDLNTMAPLVIAVDRIPYRIQKKKKPLSHFLAAHFKNQSLDRVSLHKTQGRVLVFEFAEGGRIEARLFPHGQNFMAEHKGKKIFWSKPTESSGPPVGVDEPEPRALSEVFDQWLQDKSGKKIKSFDSFEAWQKKQIKKKTKAIQKVSADLEAKSTSLWREAGSWLVENQSLEAPTKYHELIDPDKSLAANIETCFQKAKSMEGKQGGTESRLDELKQELESLEDPESARRLFAKQAKATKAASSQKGGSTLLAAAGAKGRRMDLSEGKLAFVGKSAKDNIALLRKARAWDIWLHIKDFPGNHGVIQRNKKQEISDRELRQVAQWMLSEQFKSKTVEHVGEVFEFLTTECRHVKPIKGDRLGRVNYQNVRVISVSLEA